MKKFLVFMGVCTIFCVFSTQMTSCKTKEGCGLEEKYDTARTGKAKKGKSNLFDKKMRKRMGGK